MNRLEKVIIESFKNSPQQNISDLFDNTKIPKRTLNRYIKSLIEKGDLKAIGAGRGRYYQRTPKGKSTTVAVMKSGELVGFLGHEEGRYFFEYDQSYKGKALDCLPRDATLISATLFALFENLIPESDRRDAYLSDGKNLSEILLELQNSHGDFDFISPDKLYAYQIDYTKRPNWISVKDKILESHRFINIIDIGIDIDKGVLEERGKHSSLSGYQNKIDVNIDHRRDVIAQSSDALYLLKPYNVENAVYDFKNRSQNYLPYMGLNEHLFMSFAKNSYGFDVPWSAVIAGEKDFHYLVKRYDRFDGYKYEQRDFAQIMDIKSDQKYFSTSEKLFDAVSEVVKSKEERMRFLEFYLFSCVIQHADLHLKNISVIDIGRGKKRLSPLYDLISNGVYRGDSDELGLSLNGKKQNIPLESFFDLARRIDVNKLQTKKIAKHVIELFVLKFPEYIDACGAIEAFDHLKVYKSRYSTESFTALLQRFYNRRIEDLKDRGYFKALGL